MPPYPTSHEIEDIFLWRQSPETIGKFDERLAKNLHAKVMGHDHHLAGEHRGADAWRENTRETMAGMLDTSKGIQMEAHAIGGGDTPWACVELKTTGKAKSGKKWNHECVAIVRFNLDGQITIMRTYFDSAHTNDHIVEHKKTQNGS